MWLSFLSVKAEMRGRHVETHVTVEKKGIWQKERWENKTGGEEGKKRDRRRRTRRRKNRDTLSV